MLTTATVLQRVRNLISDNSADPTQETFTETEIQDWLAEAVVDYSGYNPYRQKTSLSTVAYQDTYALPTDCEWIINVRMGPSVDLSYLYSTYAYDFFDMWVSVNEVTMNDRALWKIREDAFAFFSERNEVTWTPLNNNQLLLFPAPLDTGMSIELKYGSLHAPDTSGNYPTIPTSDTRQITSLIEATLLDILATNMTLEGNYTQSQTKMQREPALLRSRAAGLRLQVQHALGGDVVGRS